MYKTKLTFVIDLSVAINVSLADHLVDLLIGELLPEVGHDVAQLGGRYEPVAVLVEDAERFADLLLAVGVLHLARHHREELGEVYRAVAWNRNGWPVSGLLVKLIRFNKRAKCLSIRFEK